MSQHSHSQLLLISREIAHHAKMSGYSQLAGYLPAERIDNARRSLLPWGVLHSLSRIPARPYYSSSSLNKELTAFLAMLKQPGGLLHYLYLDNDFCLSPLWASHLNYRLTGTLHHPPEILEDVFRRPSDLKKLDGIFCVGENQVNAVKTIVGHERVWFLPHGVDVNFFTPHHVPFAAQLSCLFVGEMLRDFDVLRQVIVRLQAQRKDVSFTIIVWPEKQSLFAGLPGVRVLSNITDAQLCDEYRKATLLLLPLTNCTANNSILEAISCGLPVVSTDVGGIRGYLDDSCSVLCSKGDVNQLVATVDGLLSDTTLLAEMKIAARKRALAFSWDNVAAQALSIFKTHFDVEPNMI